jgi:hypothetical protein
MSNEDINYTKEVMGSNINLIFIGLMLFLSLVTFNIGPLLLLAAGQIGALFLAQNSRIQRIIRSRKNKDKKLEIEEAETAIVKNLPMNYQGDFHSVRRLCDEIEKRSGELSEDTGGKGAGLMISGIVEKLSAFRFDYARMLRAHFLLSNRNYRNIRYALEQEITRAERAVEKEQSQQVRHALAQNLHILKQRSERVTKLEELVRLLEARLQVVRNSLNLIQDEVYTFTDVSSISGLVDNLLTNLSLSDEFRTAYEDVLNAEASAVGLEALEGGTVNAMPQSEPEPFNPTVPPRERIRRVK